MSVDAYDNGELWSLDLPIIPVRCRLFPLEPIGVGTLYVESLSGYVARLAQHHFMTTEHLILAEIVPLMIQKGYNAETGNINRLFRIRASLAAENENRGDIATTLIQALEILTLRTDISQLTLLRWASAILESSVLRPHQAWCPVCYEEWYADNRIVYNPLFWSIDTTEFCLHHKHQALIDRCPYCYKQFPSLTRRSNPGYCSLCQKWLGNFWQAEKLNKQVDSEEEEWEWLSLFICPDDEKLKWQYFWLDDVEQLFANTPSVFLPPKRRTQHEPKQYI